MSGYLKLSDGMWIGFATRPTILRRIVWFLLFGARWVPQNPDDWEPRLPLVGISFMEPGDEPEWLNYDLFSVEVSTYPGGEPYTTTYRRKEPKFRKETECREK